MNQDFALVAHTGLEMLVYKPWWRAGLIHGMTTRSLFCTRETIGQAARILGEVLQVDYVALPSQCHGIAVLDLRDIARCQSIISEHGDLLCRRESDCIIGPPEQIIPGSAIAYGIMTADCVPIIARGTDGYVLIHAGWRGLANGVIRSGLSHIKDPFEAIVFAAAGPECYEVGIEVIDAIGPSSVFIPSPGRSGAYLLDTAATAINQLRALYPQMQLASADICTISDTRFHSHRRDGKAAGRGITLIIPSSTQVRS